jgi:hypothetical protein
MKTWKFVPIHSVILTDARKKKRPEYTKKQVIDIYSRSRLPSSVKNRNEFNDYDYLHKLNKEELEWLRAFHREWLNDDFKHGGERFHTTKKERKLCNDSNNSRNRDIYALYRCLYRLDFIGDNVFNLMDDQNEWLTNKNFHTIMEDE